MTDYKRLCAELLKAYEILLGELRFDNRLAKRTRAALAEPDPETMEPTDEELSDLWSWSASQDQGPWPTQQHCFARAVLARWGK